jgi:hypothetical protein
MGTVRCGIATLVACALVTPSLAAQTSQSTQGNQKPGRTTKTIGSEAITSAEALARDPRQHYGKVVMVQADVERLLGPHMFLLDEDAAFAGPDILVLVPSGTKGLAADADVRVTGTVRPYVRAELERDFDWFGEEGEVNIDLRGRPVIVADSVRTTMGGELAGAVLHVPVDASRQRQPIHVSAGQLAETPESYQAKRVTVRAEVDDVHNRQLFTLDEDRLFVGPDVIVYARDGRAIVDEDEIVTVTGVVRRFIDTDLFGTATWFDPWFNDLDATGKGLVRSRPVIIADSIMGPGGAQLYRPSERRTTSRSAGSDQPIGTSDRLDAEHPLTIGNEVTVTGTIQRMATDRAFWLDMQGRTQPIMVIVDAARMADVARTGMPRVNQLVEVTGTVKEVPGYSGQVTVSDWGMSPEDAKRFSEQPVYLYAERVRATQR